jgi:hypothetical protein
VNSRRYRLGLADGAYGPGDVAPLTLTLGRIIKGPNLPNWQPDSILAALERPVEWRGELVCYVTLNPRYTTDTLNEIREKGGVVAVGRVRPGHDPLDWTELVPAALDYWAVGTLAVLEA